MLSALRRPFATRPRLRTRITLAFAASAALLSAMVAGTTWALTRENLVNQREATATRQAFLSANTLAPQIPDDSNTESILKTLGDLENPSGSRPVLHVDGTGRGPEVWVAPNPEYGQDALPSSLKNLVAQGRSAKMLYEVNGEPSFAIGIPLAEASAQYYEIVSLTELENTLEALGVTLFGASLLTTLAGAGLGYWTSRRTLRPLANVGLAAEAIAGGRLDTRLEGVDDPDLEVLVTSFNHMAQALENRIERDGRFASDVSHELRSPLMTLAASIEVLGTRRDEMPDESAQSAIDLMRADISRFQQLVEDLLEISRFDAGVARLTLDEVRLGELVRQAVEASTERDVSVELDADLAGLMVRADKRRLVRVIANLLNNAERYAGGPTSVSVRKIGEHVQIAVEDAGPGVPAEERDVVFDRFARGGGSGRRSTGGDGVGLGLSLVKEHVGLHGGRAWVEDRPDNRVGARFVVELPVNRA
ncbi:MAG: HAMP domain-containing sensor histidine kinase [Acidimicrobiales bacterium]